MKNLMMTAAAVSALLISGCATTSGVGKTNAKHKSMNNQNAVMMAIVDTSRTEKDRAEDESRKASDVLEFSGISSGDIVVEMEAGSGYYTDIMSRIVGADGKIIMQNPAAFDAFIKAEDMEARLAPLSNVRLSKTNFDALDVPDASADIVTWFLGPHELFFTPKGGSALGDVDKTYAEIFRVLKPGGYFIALDHVAAEGSPETTGGTTHRIDPASVRERAQNAGLAFKTSSKVLHSADDDHTKNVFDPSIRRKTDRFLHKYKKPKH